ncbi:MAG: hypothetical protein ABIP30_15600 [Ferruginibacter sp.]
MKKIIAFAFLLVTVNAVAQNIEVTDSIIRFGVTAKGKLNGTKTELKIGKDGGSIQSADGKVELIFPAGALSKKTNISIQPVYNLAPNSSGNAYQMEPSGIKFLQPVKIIFHYDEEDTEGSNAELLGIAMQDEEGRWSSLKNVGIDTIAKTSTADIQHFSFYVNYKKVEISPAYARVKIKGSVRLKLRFITEGFENDELTPLGSMIQNPFSWAVNGILKGNSAVGLISTSESFSAIYQAPATVPDQNPVDIANELKLVLNEGQKSGKKILLNSKILVYDNAYEVTIVHSIKEERNGSELGAVNYMDTGSCVISIDGKNSKIIEKVNKNTAATWGYTGKCITTKLKSGPGTVHILGAQSIKVIPPAAPGDNSWIAVEFVRAPTILPLLQFKCPPVGGQGDWYTGTSAVGNAMAAQLIQAFPQRVRFEAKEGEQVIEDLKGNGAVLKITVKKLTED